MGMTEKDNLAQEQNGNSNVGIGTMTAETINIGTTKPEYATRFNCHINNIYENCFEYYNDTKKTLANADELYYVAVIGDEFTKTYKNIITESTRKGLESRILIANPESEYIRNLYAMRHFGVDEAKERIARTIKEWEQICASVEQHGVRSKGCVEIRYFDTELTNQIVMCKTPEGFIAWVTLNLPPKRGTDSIQLEFTDKKMIDTCLEYFNYIWEFRNNCKAFEYEGGIK